MTGKCPMCGYQEVIQGKDVHTIMNHYINDKTGAEICVNNKVDKFQSKDKEGNVIGNWIRKDLVQAKVEAPKSTPTTATTPSTPAPVNPFTPKPTETPAS